MPSVFIYNVENITNRKITEWKGVSNFSFLYGAEILLLKVNFVLPLYKLFQFFSVVS